LIGEQMTEAASEEEKLLEFLYAAPVGLVEISASGTIAMINPYAMKHLLPLAGMRDAGNLFSMLESCAPELRNLFEGFAAERGIVCDGHRIMVDLRRHQDGADPKVLAFTLVKLDADRAIACLSDITVQVAQERRLKQAETWFSSLINDINDYAVGSITSEGVFDAVNASWTRQTGYAGDTLIGLTLADVFPLSVEDGNIGMVEQLRLAARDGWHLDEMWHGRKDGSRYWCQRLIAARVQSDGELAGYTLVLRDITRQTYDTDDLRRLLTQDHLTGAANRSRFQQLFEREHRAWRENGTPVSLIMLDIDHFKRVNDTYGHATGDLVLTRFSDTIAQAIRPADVLARLGGEEFAVLLPATGLSEAAEIAERLRGLVADMRVETPQGDLAITVSLGCATARPEADLLRTADEALYSAKQNGRDRVYTKGRAAAA
jgi:diguanylate cyclase (GGDEF)-like protein/PAS domain S-box-containing protein